MSTPEPKKTRFARGKEVLDSKNRRGPRAVTPGWLPRAIQLRTNHGMSYDEISRAVGAPKSTVAERLKPFEILVKDPESLKVFRDEEANILDGLRQQLLGVMSEKLADVAASKKIDLQRLVYGYGVIYDKARLHRGQSTANVNALTAIILKAHSRRVQNTDSPQKTIDITDTYEGALASDSSGSLPVDDVVDAELIESSGVPMPGGTLPPQGK